MADTHGIQSWMRIRKRPDRSLDFISKEPSDAWAAVRSGGIWATFSANTCSFCLAAGCAKVDRRNPFKSLEVLRDSVSRQFAYAADLHQKISDLNKQIILRQRMITALAYRKVLENVSANTPGNGEAKRWRTFLKNTCSRPSKTAISLAKIHSPISVIGTTWRKQYSLSHLKPMAHEL